MLALLKFGVPGLADWSRGRTRAVLILVPGRCGGDRKTRRDVAAVKEVWTSEDQDARLYSARGINEDLVPLQHACCENEKNTTGGVGVLL